MLLGGRYRIARQTRTGAVFAEVSVQLSAARAAPRVQVAVSVPALWQDAACLGCRAALGYLGFSDQDTTITAIRGLVVDTTAAAVAGAAFCAVLHAAGAEVPPADAAAQWALGYPYDTLPTAEALAVLAAGAGV